MPIPASFSCPGERWTLPPWQCFGFLTEYISVPKALVDTQNYKYPIGPAQYRDFVQTGKLRKDVNSYEQPGNTGYRRDPRALKLISQEQWELERPVYDYTYQEKMLGSESDFFIQAQRLNNFVRRMVPHALGYFPMTSAWVIIVTHLEQAKHDIAKISDMQIPAWVNALIYGTVLIFWSFSAVQIVFQRMPPGFYFGSEICYCLLSLTAKMYLGFFLLYNVIAVDASVEEALAPADAVMRR